ncbi:MAG TPA: shikimate dehydrogenase [bacterium]|nr:shikimate dehydrogenase [bacterium]
MSDLSKAYGVVGWPAAHSLSPAIHQYVFERMGLNHTYQRKAVPSGGLEIFLNWAARNWSGFNVTLPHKETIVSLMHGLSSTAQRIGAVNTVIRDGNQWYGENTDAGGFVKALLPLWQGESRAVLLGAGGAARAVIHGLYSLHIRQVDVLDPNPEAIRRFTDHVRLFYEGLRMHVIGPGDLNAALYRSRLLVNASPVGLPPEKEKNPLPGDIRIPSGMLVMDLIPRTDETPLVKKAREGGAAAVGGLSMLIHQALLSQQAWTGRSIPDTWHQSIYHHLTRGTYVGSSDFNGR